MYPNLQDIPQQLDATTELAILTIAQIKKDFLSNGLEIRLEADEHPTYEKLKSELSAVLDWLFENDSQKLMQLLYRIDLPEQKLNEALAAARDEAVSALIAALIVQREAQKVIIRKFYQNTSAQQTDPQTPRNYVD